MKLTKQGVRDLNAGTNGRRRHTHRFAPVSGYHVAPGDYEVTWTTRLRCECGAFKDEQP